MASEQAQALKAQMIDMRAQRGSMPAADPRGDAGQQRDDGPDDRRARGGDLLRGRRRRRPGHLGHSRRGRGRSGPRVPARWRLHPRIGRDAQAAGRPSGQRHRLPGARRRLRPGPREPPPRPRGGQRPGLPLAARSGLPPRAHRHLGRLRRRRPHPGHRAQAAGRRPPAAGRGRTPVALDRHGGPRRDRCRPTPTGTCCCNSMG